MRIAIGLILIPHGCQRFFGWFHGFGFDGFNQLFDKLGYHPGVAYTVIAGSVELVGGICLLLGLFTRAAALFLVIFMIFGIQFTSQKGFFWTQGGAEYSLLILVVGLVFLIAAAACTRSMRACRANSEVCLPANTKRPAE